MTTQQFIPYTITAAILLALIPSAQADPPPAPKRTASISGTVVYETTHKPAAGVEVGAFKDNGELGYTTSDNSGHYTISSLPPGTYTVAIGPEQEPLKDWTSSADPTTLTSGEQTAGVTVTLTHGSTVTGKITDKLTGKPVPSIMVDATLQGQYTFSFSTTGPDGIYRFHILPGKYDLTLNTMPNPNDQNDPVHFQAVKDETESFDYQITAPLIVHGTVVGPDGKPLARANVDVNTSIQGPNNSTTTWGNNITTDAQGHFVFKTPTLQQDTELTAQAKTPTGDLSTASPVTSTGTDDVTLHLVPIQHFTVTGRVIDRSGQPVPNAYVSLLSTQPGFHSNDPGTHTDAGGRYTFTTNSVTSDYMVSAQPAGYSTAASGKLDGSVGNTLQVPDLTVTATNAVLGGTLVDIKGNPIANADISDNQHPDTKATTDQNGHFLLKGLRTGSIALIIHTQDGRWDNYITDSGNANSILTMPARVNGIVLGPDGKPVPGAKVTAQDTNYGPQTVTTDSTGQFTIDSPGLKPKTPILARSLTLATTWPVLYNGEDKVILRLAPGSLCTFAGKIIDSDGAPAPGVTVNLTRWAKDIDGQIEEVKTDSNGQYTFDPIYSNAKYIISASGKGYGQAASEAILAGSNQSIQVPQLTLPIADSFAAGTVVDSKGIPIAGATVADQDITSPFISATTDQAGHFILKNVPRGKTSVCANAPGTTYAVQTITTGRGDNIIYLQKPDDQK